MSIDRSISIKAKTERAKEHLDNIKSEVNAFLESDTYTVVPEDEQQAGDRVFRVCIKRNIPLRWALIAGDAIHNLRSALDHLAWQLVEANGATPDEKTEFPIGHSADHFETRCLRKIQGASDEAVSFIKSLYPYKGGDERFLALHLLDIVDKHRLLITVGARRDAVMLGPEAIKSVEFRQGGSDGPVVTSPFIPESVASHFPPLHRACPLENGTEIYRIGFESSRVRKNDRFSLRTEVDR